MAFQNKNSSQQGTLEDEGEKNDNDDNDDDFGDFSVSASATTAVDLEEKRPDGNQVVIKPEVLYVHLLFYFLYNEIECPRHWHDRILKQYCLNHITRRTIM